MKRVGLLKGATLSLACLGLVAPQSALMAGGPQKDTKAAQKAPAAAVSDVALAKGGVLTGKVVDGQGMALDGAAVSLRQSGKEVAATVSDKSGNFKVSNVKGGTYHLVAGQGESAVRLWTVNTAPPSARSQALVVSETQVVRGQVLGGNVSALGVAGIGLGIAGVTIAAVNTNKINNLQDQVDQIPTSP